MALFSQIEKNIDSIVIGLSKGRPLELGITLLRQQGLQVIREDDNERNFCFQSEIMQTHDGNNIHVHYLIIHSRDVASFLLNHVIDIAVGFDDVLYHLEEPNFHLKSIVESPETCSRICLIGKKEKELNNPFQEYHSNQIIFSEYQRYPFLYPGPRYILCNGTSESAIINNIADYCIAIVETGNTLEQNQLQIIHEYKKLKLGIWCNIQNKKGYYMYSLWMKEPQYLYIDGLDGVGKDTLLELLQKDVRLRRYVLVNRSCCTGYTLLPFQQYPIDFPSSPQHIHIILTASLDNIEKRLRKRKLPRDLWESREALSYFHFKYTEIAFKYGLHLIDTSNKTPPELLNIVHDIVKNKNTTYQCPLVDQLSEEEFNQLEKVAEGDSKCIRRLNDQYDLVKLIPSIYSHKQHRAGFIEGSDILRRNVSRNIRYVLAYHCIPHTWTYIGNQYIVVERLHNLPPPIEVVIKSRWEGTDKYRYVGLEKYTQRDYYDSDSIQNPRPLIVQPDTHLYDTPYVRFDWRNQNTHIEGDICLSETLANQLINVPRAKNLALKTFSVLRDFYSKIHVDVWDMCLFITEDGSKIFSEISQDNARYKYNPSLSSSSSEAASSSSAAASSSSSQSISLDKDIWRSGNSSEDVLEKWKKLDELVQTYLTNVFTLTSCPPYNI